MKYEERKLKHEILKLRIPIFRLSIKFNKLIVILCVAAIVLYTIAAILLQKYTSMELSPTLTTCVYTFFGTELLGLAGIKIFDTKYKTVESSVESYEDINKESTDSSADDEEQIAVG